jgi:hypothetical protein
MWLRPSGSASQDQRTTSAFQRLGKPTAASRTVRNNSGKRVLAASREAPQARLVHFWGAASLLESSGQGMVAGLGRGLTGDFCRISQPTLVHGPMRRRLGGASSGRLDRMFIVGCLPVPLIASHSSSRVRDGHGEQLGGCSRGPMEGAYALQGRCRAAPASAIAGPPARWGVPGG